MLDIETLATSPDATILTIAAQTFDPLGEEHTDGQYLYVRVSLDDQQDRSIDDATINWWAKQPAHIQKEAFGDDDRVSLSEALVLLSKMIRHSKRLWCQGPTFDCTILEHAYKSFGMFLPWEYYNVRDTRTIFSLVPNLDKPLATHNALEDVRRQISLLKVALGKLGVESLG